jgi:UV excision repair protein RAD23
VQASVPESLPPPVEQASASESPSTAAAASPTPGAALNSTSLSSDSSFLSGEALQSTIQNMVDMGFPRDQVLRALRASFNNPDRAVEYLMTVGLIEFLYLFFSLISSP